MSTQEEGRRRGKLKRNASDSGLSVVSVLDGDDRPGGDGEKERIRVSNPASKKSQKKEKVTDAKEGDPTKREKAETRAGKGDRDRGKEKNKKRKEKKDTQTSDSDESEKENTKPKPGFFVGHYRSEREKKWRKKVGKHRHLLVDLLNVRLTDFETHFVEKMENRMHAILREPRPVDIQKVPLSVTAVTPPSSASAVSSPSEPPPTSAVQAKQNLNLLRRRQRGPNEASQRFSKYMEEVAERKDALEMRNLFFLMTRGDVMRADPAFFSGGRLVRECLEEPWAFQRGNGKEGRWKILESYIMQAVGLKTTVDNNNMLTRLFNVIHGVF
uniref:Uncharacterized protein n=1 Tax=Chromera velia CCMP2878 TaxID=1169474 RepID=A0A0G4IF68_9ALVE|eukprot:Cvel_13934.t1-p1 / transcript=Cvel_13934.t1 / gene=Cvel_13934 / organism=Chromera_velia_CCMP2878 / gene_product=hypothetical protein / transcript_product=hypothetical protein / location=Cvel_scaffold972:16130-17339(-) / protein_length=326 / sequence_SO=supercontig / SO=protein_coding / is_pseudo=false